MNFEDKRPIIVKKPYDVIVVGGGIAGVSAAVAAARKGVSVLLLEMCAAIVLMILFFSICIPKKYDLKVGSVAHETIDATKDVVDEVIVPQRFERLFPMLGLALGVGVLRSP